MTHWLTDVQKMNAVPLASLMKMAAHVAKLLEVKVRLTGKTRS